MSQDLTSRHVGGKAAPGATRLGCPMRGCDGTTYEMQGGELLSRMARTGWHPEERTGTCNKCGHVQQFRVMVRDAEGAA